MDLREAKKYGGIGAILSLFGGIVPYIGIAITIAGIILLLLAVKKISEAVNNQEIFKNYVIYFILGIIGVIAGIAVFLVYTGYSILPLLKEEMGTGFKLIKKFFIGLFLALAVYWVFGVIGAIYYKKSYDAISHHTKVDLFSTTALIYLIGMATVIVFVGFIVVFVAKVLEIVAFFSLPETT
ncbi:MAG TPA: DUF996 domain-containing protein [Thermoplasmatales archaeon]|nr:DUF996 domain-containing protein [Thermoplasmatales archaeon]